MRHRDALLFQLRHGLKGLEEGHGAELGLHRRDALDMQGMGVTILESLCDRFNRILGLSLTQ